MPKITIPITKYDNMGGRRRSGISDSYNSQGTWSRGMSYHGRGTYFNHAVIAELLLTASENTFCNSVSASNR